MGVGETLPTLVSTEWVEAHKGDADVRVLQAVFPEHCYSSKGVPGGLEYEEQECCAKSQWHTMLPDAELFARYVGEKLGISSETHVVVYDASELSRGGLETAARVWFTFRVFGHRRVSLMEGGLAKWKAEGRPLGPSPAPRPEPKLYTGAHLDESRIVTFQDVQMMVEERSASLVDSRSAARFRGEAMEPAGGVSGAIAGSISCPFPKLVNPTTGEFKSAEELRKMFASLGVEMSRSFVATCGTGTTACGLNIAWEMLSGDIGRLYDGSWYEYSRRLGINPMPEPFEEAFTRLRSNSIPQKAH